MYFSRAALYILQHTCMPFSLGFVPHRGSSARILGCPLFLLPICTLLYKWKSAELQTADPATQHCRMGSGVCDPGAGLSTSSLAQSPEWPAPLILTISTICTLPDPSSFPSPILNSIFPFMVLSTEVLKGIVRYSRHFLFCHVWGLMLIKTLAQF